MVDADKAVKKKKKEKEINLTASKVDTGIVSSPRQHV